MYKFFSGTTVFGLLLSGFAAPAVQAQTLSLGGDFVHVNFTRDGGVTTHDEGGGSVKPSTLDGVALPFVYCVDLDHDIGVPNTYAPTPITEDGRIYDTPVNNANQVAWLIDQYAAGATTNDQQGGLQAAIWHTIYGPTNALVSGGNTTAGEITAYNLYLTNVGSDPVSNLKWLSPTDAKSPRYQGLVTVTNVPEPGAIALLTVSLAAGGAFSLRRRRNRK